MSELCCQFNGHNKGFISSSTLVVFFNTNILLRFGVYDHVNLCKLVTFILSSSKNVELPITTTFLNFLIFHMVT